MGVFWIFVIFGPKIKLLKKINSRILGVNLHYLDIPIFLLKKIVI